MSNNISRRGLIAATALLAAPTTLRAQTSARLLIIGGGFGGASAASFARRHYPEAQVTLVEPNTQFVTCPYGNLLLAGERQISHITHSYDGLRARGVRILHDRAIGIDAPAKRVRLQGGDTLTYDRLILSPGIAMPGSPAMARKPYCSAANWKPCRMAVWWVSPFRPTRSAAHPGLMNASA